MRRDFLWSWFVKSLTNERESKRERFGSPASFLLLPATPATDFFDSGIKIDQLIDIYTYIDLDFVFDKGLVIWVFECCSVTVESL